MFTGIIERMGRVEKTIERGSLFELLVNNDTPDLRVGESIAIEGVCVTMTEVKQGMFACQISPETRGLTTLGDVRQGRWVNLERPLMVSSRLGGHFVLGHVDQKAFVEKMETKGDFLRMTFEGVGAPNMRYLVKKGSIAINGISLTLNEIYQSGFEVMLIPVTLRETSLGKAGEGSEVNLEFDWLAKLVVDRLGEFEKLRKRR